jgi:hypothetical protein
MKRRFKDYKKFTCRANALSVRLLPSSIFSKTMFFLQGRPPLLIKKKAVWAFFSNFGFRPFFFQSSKAPKMFGAFKSLYSFFKFSFIVLDYFSVFNIVEFCSKCSLFFSELESRKFYPVSFSLNGYVVPFSNFFFLSQSSFDRNIFYRFFNFLSIYWFSFFFLLFFVTSKLKFFIFFNQCQRIPNF